MQIRLHTLLGTCALAGALSGSAAASPLGPLIPQELGYLDQGWDAAMRTEFYTTPQGSRLIPSAWLGALEVAGSTGLFTSRANLESYGWSYASGTEVPGELPVGFVVDPVKLPTGKWAGLSCAACHTSDIELKGKRYRVDGGPSSVDFQAFMTGLSTAVNQTALSAEKRERFMQRLEPRARRAAATYFDQFAVELSGSAATMASPIHPGPGRIDALTQIINSIAVTDLQEPQNAWLARAPVDIPFLWTTPQQDFVQWNPIASNPLARNLGEVLGVFGHVNLRLPTKPDPSLTGEDASGLAIEAHRHFPGELSAQFASAEKAEAGAGAGLLSAVDLTKPRQTTALLDNLYSLEQWIASLGAPVWQDAFGAVDPELAQRGKALFARDCLGCHNMPPYRMTAAEENIAGKQFIEITRVPYTVVGTDPLYIENILGRLTKTGALEPFLGSSAVPAGKMFLSTVGTLTMSELQRLGFDQRKIMEYSDYRFFPPVDGRDPEPYTAPSLTDLKAGPLVGIWATGPFLHNGSVPTLYELLSPVAERRAVFHKGSRELDTMRIGFVDDGLGQRYDTSFPGNSNAGHAYPKDGYSPAERWAVIEYLKAPERVD